MHPNDFTDGVWMGLCRGQVAFVIDATGQGRAGPLTAPIGEWVHLAVTDDGTTRRHYLNGMLDFEGPQDRTLPVLASDFAIGGLPDGGLSWEGHLAEVRVWDYARSQDEIRQDLVRQADSRRPGLIAAWTLEGGAAEVLGNDPGVPRGAAFDGPAAPRPGSGSSWFWVGACAGDAPPGEPKHRPNPRESW